MATVVYRNGIEEYRYDFYELATEEDWSPIDHVELSWQGRTLESRSPGEFWRQVRELAGVEVAA